MNHARTFTRYACLAGLVAGLLAPVQSLAQQTSPSRPTITSVSSAGTSGSDILARVSANTQPQALGSRIYWTQQVSVSRQTLRAGALAAMRRGVMHPGLQVAMLAAGYLLTDDGVEVPDSEDDFTNHFDDLYSFAESRNRGLILQTSVWPLSSRSCSFTADNTYRLDTYDIADHITSNGPIQKSRYDTSGSQPRVCFVQKLGESSYLHQRLIVLNSSNKRSTCGVEGS